MKIWLARLLVIAVDYQGKDLVLVSILKGALPFLADLMRATQIPLALDFLEVSSYGARNDHAALARPRRHATCDN